jgi:hypothetical protein
MGRDLISVPIEPDLPAVAHQYTGMEEKTIAGFSRRDCGVRELILDMSGGKAYRGQAFRFGFGCSPTPRAGSKGFWVFLCLMTRTPGKPVKAGRRQEEYG